MGTPLLQVTKEREGCCQSQKRREVKKMVQLVVALFVLGQALGHPSQTQSLLLRSNPFSYRESLEAAQEQQDLRVKLNEERSSEARSSARAADWDQHNQQL